ncbi:MAG: hypothetical protein ACI8WT_001791 [Clostridium sp.]|jgi:hypothetical protein
MARNKDENAVNPTDFKNSIMDCLSNRKLYDFVKFYCTTDQSKKSYDAIKHLLNNVEFEYAMENHLTRADVQNAIRMWTKTNKDMNLLKVYNVMLNKALEGDVKSAEYIMRFNSSDFFKDDAESELSDFVSGLNINIGDNNE